jgi:hypothetical protein
MSDLRITMTLHQLKRMVMAYYDLEDCKSLDDVATRILMLAELCSENDCEECAATVKSLRRLG